MPFAYPVFLELGGRRCVVIGDNAVREGKVEGLLAAGAGQVIVIAEGPPGQLDALEQEHEPFVAVERRAWRPDDLDGAYLCVASDPAAATRAAIAKECRARGVLVNVMDDIENSDWAAPALVRRGDLVLAVSTGGRSPALAKKLRQELEARFGAEWADVLSVLRQAREETLPELPDLGERARRWARALDLDEAEELVRDGRHDELADRLRSRLLETT